MTWQQSKYLVFVLQYISIALLHQDQIQGPDHLPTIFIQNY